MKNGSLPILVLALIFMVGACSDDNYAVVNPDSSEELALADGEGPLFAAKGAANKITICHTPPGNPGNPQVITVGEKAAAKHLSQHDGDGLVGSGFPDYDENCVRFPEPEPEHAWGQGAVFVYDSNPNGARRFPFGVYLSTRQPKEIFHHDFGRACFFTDRNDPTAGNTVDLVINGGPVIGTVTTHCPEWGEMSFTYDIFPSSPWVLQDVESLIDNAPDCGNLKTIPIPSTNLSSWDDGGGPPGTQPYEPPFPHHFRYLSESVGGKTATLGPFSALQVYTDQTSCAVVHAIVVASS